MKNLPAMLKQILWKILVFKIRYDIRRIVKIVAVKLQEVTRRIVKIVAVKLQEVTIQQSWELYFNSERLELSNIEIMKSILLRLNSEAVSKHMSVDQKKNLIDNVQVSIDKSHDVLDRLRVEYSAKVDRSKVAIRRKQWEVYISKK